MKQYVTPESERAEWRRKFSWGPISRDQRDRGTSLGESYSRLAQEVLSVCRTSRERSIALTHLQDSFNMAVVAICLESPAEEEQS